MASRRFHASRRPSTTLADDWLNCSAHFAKSAKAVFAGIAPAMAVACVTGVGELFFGGGLCARLAGGWLVAAFAVVVASGDGGGAEAACVARCRDNKNSARVEMPTINAPTMRERFMRTLSLEF